MTNPLNPQDLSRRTLLIGSLPLLLAACSSSNASTAESSASASVTESASASASASVAPSVSATPSKIPVSRNPITKRTPWPGTIHYTLPGEGNYVAWTVDDGASPECVRAYCEFAKRTGTRLTFFINASYTSFKQNIDLLKPLVDSGQIQIANHTYNHPDLLSLDKAGVMKELTQNEDAIKELFGVSSKPYFRPPFGRYSDDVLKWAGYAGFTRPVLWNGTLGDEYRTSPRVIDMRSNQYLRAQAIALGHLNYTTIIPLLDDLKALLDERGLVTVTLNDYYEAAKEEEYKKAEEPPAPSPSPSESAKPSASASASASAPAPAASTPAANGLNPGGAAAPTAAVAPVPAVPTATLRR